jgi:hypothetical protein
MNLLDQAQQDISFTVEDKDNGFGRAVILQDKSGTRYGENDEIIAKVTDIGFFIDPGNDVGVQGRTTWIELSLSTLATQGVNIPETGDGWQVFSNDSQGQEWPFEIIIAAPDRTIGLLKLNLKLLDIS